MECGFTLKPVRDMIRTDSQMHRTDKYSQHSSIIFPVEINGWVFVYELSVCGFESRYGHLNLWFCACFEQGVPWHSGNYEVWLHSDIQATLECGFTLKRVRNMIRTDSQMHRTDKYSQDSSIIWPVGINDWMFVYELSGCGFESRCSHLIFSFRAYFDLGIPWHSSNYGVRIHSETRHWHDKKRQSNAPYR